MLLWRMPNVTKKNLIIIKSIIFWKWTIFSWKHYFRKKKWIVMDYAWWLSGHLCFNGQQKSPVASLNWNPWLHNLVSNRIYICFFCGKMGKHLWTKFKANLTSSSVKERVSLAQKFRVRIQSNRFSEKDLEAATRGVL